MGIDIYLNWDGQTPAEKKAQYTGFSVTSGNLGYLREAYHGGPYATRYLVSEAFAAEGNETAIPAATLRQRLPATVMLAVYRDHIVYHGEKEPGVITETDGGISALASTLTGVFSDIEKMKAGKDETDLGDSLSFEQKTAVANLIGSRQLPDYALSFVDFVELAERKEAETGKPCTVVASY